MSKRQDKALESLLVSYQTVHKQVNRTWSDCWQALTGLEMERLSWKLKRNEACLDGKCGIRWANGNDLAGRGVRLRAWMVPAMGITAKVKTCLTFFLFLFLFLFVITKKNGWIRKEECYSLNSSIACIKIKKYFYLDGLPSTESVSAVHHLREMAAITRLQQLQLLHPPPLNLRRSRLFPKPKQLARLRPRSFSTSPNLCSNNSHNTPEVLSLFILEIYIYICIYEM